MQQRFDRGLVALGDKYLKLVPGRSEPCAAHQVGHQRNIMISHV
jgi:hypothetical protein